MSKRPIEQVLAEHTDQWMKIPGVVGTGIGEKGGRPCIKVFVARTPSRLTKQIPSEVDGYPVVIEETGTFKAR